MYHLQAGTLRFNQLFKLMPQVTQQILTRQLRECESDAVVCRTQDAEIPPRVEYSLTSQGRSLAKILQLLKIWGEQQLKGR